MSLVHTPVRHHVMHDIACHCAVRCNGRMGLLTVLSFCAADDVKRERQIEPPVDPLPHGMGGDAGSLQCKSTIPLCSEIFLT